MFKKEDGMNSETIIANGVRVEGDFVSPGNVRIDGLVKGSVRADGDLVVSETASIDADVQATNAVIAGEVKGDVSVAEKMELLPTARLHGNLSSKVLTVAAGAVLMGNCSVSPEKQAPAPRGRGVKQAAEPADEE
jgi:cytoskeletal protein CcmA (bactofilin family)